MVLLASSSAAASAHRAESAGSLPPKELDGVAVSWEESSSRRLPTTTRRDASDASSEVLAKSEKDFSGECPFLGEFDQAAAGCGDFEERGLACGLADANAAILLAAAGSAPFGEDGD